MENGKNFEALVGEHVLSGIELGQIVRKDCLYAPQDAGYIKFTLDGITYQAFENPDDGWRSYMDELVTTDEPCKYKLPDIITGKEDKPYYEVSWYDLDEQKWRIGYSSYDLSIVHDYIKQYFNVVEKYVDVQITRHGYWEWFEEWSPGTPDYPIEVEDCGWRCSNCKTELEDVVGGHWNDYTEHPDLKYCPECGAKMHLKGADQIEAD